MRGRTRTPWRRRGLAPLGLALIVWAPAPAAPPAPEPVAGLTGLVRDSAGRLLAGSVVLAVPLSGAPARTATTLGDGRYLFAQLAPGSYHITAVKDGYRAGTVSVNTLLRRSLDLVLTPGTSVDAELEGSSAWLLRVPPRDLLRDLAGGVVPAAAEDGSDQSAVAPGLPAPVRASSFQLPLNGEVQQWFSQQAPGATDGQPSDSSGNATSLKLGMRVGERLDLSVAGARERQNLKIEAGEGPSGSVAGSEAVGLDIGYELGSLSRLDVNASYQRSSLLLEGVDAGSAADADRQSVTRSCSTGWRRVLGGAGSVEASALYVDEMSRDQSEAGLFGPDQAVSRLWRAGGLFRTPVGSDHTVTVAVKARMFQTEGTDAWALTPPSGGSPWALAGPAPPGWAVHVHGDEQWALNPALGLDIGFDYHKGLSAREVSHLVPQIGATYRPASGTVLDAELSWLTDSATDTAESHAALPVGSAGRRDSLGYALQIEQRIGGDTVLAASTASRPIAYEYETEPGVQPASDLFPIYLSDGLAQSRESGVEVRHRFGPLTASAGSSWGRIEGRYAAIHTGGPVREMRQGRLDYSVAALPAASRDGGTEARLEYRTLSEGDLVAESPQSSRSAAISLHVSQALDFLQLGETRWRVMLAWQDNLEPPPEEDEEGVHHRPLLSNDRVSGGVSVRF